MCSISPRCLLCRSVDDPIASNENNVNGTLNVLHGARCGRQAYVYSGSSSAYGDIDLSSNPKTWPPSLSRMPSPSWPASSTARCSLRCTVGSGNYPLLQRLRPAPGPILCLRGGDPEVHVVYAGRRAAIIEAMACKRAISYIDNVVHGNLLACHTPEVAGEVFNIACGGQINLLDMVAILNRLLGKTIEPRFPDPRPGDVRHSRVDRRPGACWATSQSCRSRRAGAQSARYSRRWRSDRPDLCPPTGSSICPK